jgi:Ca2+-binding EF-hand superfamily protein
MQNTLRYALLAGAVLAAGAGVAVSQISQSVSIETPAPTDMTGSAERPQGRFGDRFMAEFDLNHDGKVTKDEFNKVVAQHFMQASGGKPTMTVDQFTNAHMTEFKQRVGEMFHRIDWNGDGRLSLEEYAAPIRARFEMMDRDGSGTARCFGRSNDDGDTHQTNNAQNRSFGHRRYGGGGFRGRGNLCAQYDTDHSGQLSRAQLDKAVQVQFAGASKGGSMSFDQFYSLELARYRDLNARIFNRIDRNHTGAINEAEYVGSEMRFFGRLDKNNDGTVTQDEFSFHRREGGNRNGNQNWQKKPS